MKKPPLVIKNLKEILDLNRLNDLGVEEIARGNYQNAINIFLSILRKHPSFMLAYYNLGNLYLSLEMFNEALYYFKEGIKIDDQHAKSFLGIGLVLSQMGKITEAIPYYKKAYQLDPSLKKISLPKELFSRTGSDRE